MKNHRSHPIRRAAALALALLLLLPGSLALAQPADQPVTITLNYTHPNGTPEFLTAVPAGYPGYEDAWWLFVNQHAEKDPAATLTVTDNFGTYPGGFLLNGAPYTASLPASPFYAYDADRSLAGPFIELLGLGPNGETLAAYRLFISLKKEAPDPPEVVVIPAVVTVRYVDVNGQEITREQRELQPGASIVAPDASRVPADYQLTGQGEYQVLVDANGANPPEVTFTYQLAVQPAAVTVRYLDQNGQELASEQRMLQPGQTAVTPDPGKVPQNYQFTGPAEYVVIVDANGANPASVSFNYQLAVQPAAVTVRYLDQNGQELASEQRMLQPGQTAVTPDAGKVPANYQFLGPAEHVVTVDANGANPATVSFNYQLAVQPAAVTIRYLDQNGQELASEQRMLQPGQTAVTPDPGKVPANYQFLGPAEYVVIVDANGANPASVSFNYQLAVQPAAVTVRYLDQNGQELASEQRMLQPGQTAVTPDAGKVPANYQFLGPAEYMVTVDANGANPASVSFNYQLAVQPAAVTVRYLDQNGQELASEQRMLQPGQTAVTPDAGKVPANYQFLGPAEYMVTVDANGANPASVSFNYQLAIQPAAVTVRYLDQNGQELASEQRMLQPGQTAVTPDAGKVPANYQFLGPAEHVVTVDANGANPASVSFNYQLAIQPAAVTVRYLDQNGQELASEQRMLQPGQTAVTPDAGKVPANYQFLGPAEHVVTVDANGVNPASVTFNYQLAVQPAAITIRYLDQNGQELASEQRTLQPGQTAVTPDPSKVPANYQLTGQGEYQVLVDGSGANPKEVAFTYQLAVQPAAVTIHYQDGQGNQVADSAQVTLGAGTHTVLPSPNNLKPNHVLSGPEQFSVTVDQYGANPSMVTFIYSPVAQTSSVTIHYRDGQGGQVAASQQKMLEPGVHEVYAQPESLAPGYTLTGPDVQSVSVDVSGANPAEIVFVYKAPEATAVPQSVQVLVRYLDEGNNQVASPQTLTLQPGVTEVTPAPGDLLPGYQLLSAGSVTVTVEGSGAVPGEVVFTYYQAPPVSQPVSVTVSYVDAEGNRVAGDSVFVASEGTNTVSPQPADLPEGYALAPGEDAVKNVTVVNNVAEPASLTFVYLNTEAAAPTPAVENELFADGDIIDRWAEVTVKGGVNFRAQATTGSEKLGYLEQGERFWVSGQETVNGDVWYKAISNGKTGYVMAQYARLFTLEESLQYQATLPTPVPPSLTPTPVPTQAPTAVPTAEPTAVPQSVQVLVRYLDEGNNQVASPQTLTLQPGVTEVTPAPGDLLPGYQLLSAGSVTVTVEGSGAVPGEVVFTYYQAPPVSQPVSVTVSYVDAEGNRVAGDSVFVASEGTNTVSPQPADLPEGYALAAGEDAVQYVTVVNNVAQPASLTFVYQKIESATPTPAPAPKAALVKVLYKNEAGDLLFSDNIPCKEGEQTLIAPDLSRVNTTQYQLIGPESVLITLDASGNPSQNEVVFQFRDVTVKKATITLHYRDEAGNALSPSQTVEIQAGTYQIEASPDALPAGMELASQSPVTVTLSESGVLSHQELVFLYRKPATPSPAPTPSPEPTALPFDVATMDRYAYPTGDSINFRSSPDTSGSGNIIAALSKSDLAHILGSVRNRQGEEWYLADVAGREGFLKATVVRLLEFNEAAAIFGWTPTPAPTPVPEQYVPADGDIIDRWAEVTERNGVNFRAQASTGSTKISQLERGERFWVYSQQTVGEDVWYSVMANGKTGWLMAKYTRLFTGQESAQYQSQLATPMPYAVTATPIPPAVTEAPLTPVPTDTPVPATPQPTAYHGYALTTRQAALRTGANQPDEPVLEIVEVNNLVYVWGQTYIGGEGWSNVQVMKDNIYGYLPNASLRYIAEQEAAFYLSQLQPQATPSPVPTPLPEQRTGYAITLGENVPMRAFTDTNAQILNLLPDSSVVSIRGQEYTSGAVWHLVQYGAGYGYVRADQMRMLNAAEETAYLQSLRTPTPQPAATLPPATMDSPSSYGYVNTDRVRLRSEASTTSRELKLMSKNAFALVYSSVIQPDGVWYRISQEGTTGYVHGNFFTVLPMGQLSSYLQSADYLNANSASIPVAGGFEQPVRITPVEDYNATVWQNPNLINPSYEPFNPLGTATPSVEAILTPSPTPSASPSPTPLFIEGFEEPPEKADSTFPTGLVVVGILALLGGGGYYAYHLYNQNQKRAAQRAAQRRAQLAQQQGQPQARPAQQQPASPYAPPRPGMQGTAQYKPGTTPPAAGGGGQAPQGTAQYRPGMTPPSAGQPGQAPQGTTQYRPGMTPPTAGQPGQAPQGTAQYRPATPPAAGNQGENPLAPPQNRPLSASELLKPRDPAGPGAAKGGAEPGTGKPTQGETAQATEARRRRSERHNNT